MELKDTIELMTSSDYKDRFKAEYYQLVIRYNKLKNMVDNWINLDFKPTCSKTLYEIQLRYMYMYLEALKRRAEKEKIEL